MTFWEKSVQSFNCYLIPRVVGEKHYYTTAGDIKGVFMLFSILLNGYGKRIIYYRYILLEGCQKVLLRDTTTNLDLIE